jgi:hypothetical protein
MSLVFFDTRGQGNTFYKYIIFSNQELKNSTFMINASGAYSFPNNAAYNYGPIAVSSSSPMVKITASDTIVDFNNIGVFNTDTTRSGWIGIEIGWTPVELAADPTRVQPKNVSILNLSLYNFDCGIIVHEGVQLTQIVNIAMYDVSVGIAMLGTLNLDVHDIQISQVKIKGHSKNYHAALVNLKTIIETTYGYGADYFMPLQPDTLNGNVLDVYTYFGIWAHYLSDSIFDAVSVDEIGYGNFAISSEGNGNRTQGIGISLHNSKHMNIYNTFAIRCSSELKAVGMQLDGIEELDLKSSNFLFGVSKKRTVGIEVTNNALANYSCQAIILDDVTIKNNASDEVVIGLDFTSVQGFTGTNVKSKFNKGGQQTYGLYTTQLDSVDLRNSKFNSNQATQLTNTVATQQGIIAVGFYGQNVTSMLMQSVELGDMKALNSAYGMYLQNSSSCVFNECDFTANKATSMRSGEAAAIRSQQDAQEISKHAPVVPAANTGAYGLFCDTCDSMRFSTCFANTNEGHRAIGMRFQNCWDIDLRECYGSGQQATGSMFDATLFTDNSATPHAVAIMPANKSLLFGSLTKTTVDALAATDSFLVKMTAIRTAQAAGTEPTYSDVIAMIATGSLLQATVARYRLWGTAIGVHCHNVTGFSMNNLICTGQISALDSGIGICCTGRNSAITINNCKSMFHIGGNASVVTPATSPTATYTYSYNLIGTKLFWDMLTNGLTTPFPIAATIDAVGIVSSSTVFSAQGNKAFGDGTSGDNVYVKLNGTDHRVIVSPIGPISAGLVMGDINIEGFITNSTFYGGLGNAGHVYGILLDTAFSVILQNNVIAGNISNIYGFTAGIFDMTAHSPNLFMKNFLEGNKCSTFNNSSYFIPFNSADSNGLAFPVTKMMNGKFIDTITDNDNIEMQYSQQPQFYSVEYVATIPQHPDLLSYLTTNSLWA